MIGLYQIVHLPSGRTYIGSSDNVARRLSQHRHLLRRGVADNVWLQRTWDRDGEAAFAFRPVEECPIDTLREREADVIDEFSGPLFNLSPVVRRGARAPNSSLSDDDVREIHRRAAAGERTEVLMRDFGVIRVTIDRIVAGRTYTRVTGGKKARGAIRARGERVTVGKLTEAQALDALRRYRAGELRNHIARSLGVSFASIAMLVTGKTWKHLHDASSAAA